MPRVGLLWRAACNTQLGYRRGHFFVHCQTCNYRSAPARSAREAHELFIAERPRCERSGMEV